MSLDDHSDAFTIVMKFCDLNERPHIIDLIQTTYHITLIATGKNIQCTVNREIFAVETFLQLVLATKIKHTKFNHMRMI